MPNLRLRARLTILALVCGGAVLPAMAARADAPTHSVTVTATAGGSTVTTYPAYDASVSRYAVIPDGTTNGDLTVTATSSDSAATVTVDGRPAADGQPFPVTGLTPGDEISVQIQDSGAAPVSQSWIYLPTGFPHLTVTDDHSSDPGSSYYFLGLGSFLSTTGFEAVVDHNGVPVHVGTQGGQDLKAYTDGQGNPLYYTVARKAGTGPVMGSTYEIDKLGLDFQVEQVIHPDDLAALDFHDSVVNPDGSALLMGESTHHASGQDWLDAVIETIDAQGNTVFRWDSANHTDPADAYLSPNGDYAHINSLQWLPDGDVIASFRNLSTVMRIATSAHDGFQPGDVEWELGGKHSTFAYVGDPEGGQCAQHSARMIDATHIQIFDNGSMSDPSGPIGAQSADMCPSPGDPTTRRARPQTRVVTYALDTQAQTATLRQSYEVDGRYAPFAGNWQNEPNGDRVIGWSQSQQTTGTPPIATEVGPGGNELWAVQAPGWFSYRVFKFPAPDVQAPVITDATAVTDGSTLAEGDPPPTADFGCTDTGGSNLTSCTGSVANGQPLAMTPGHHVFSVSAQDGAGNVATAAVSYDVLPTYQPDARVRTRSGAWLGGNVFGDAAHQTVTRTVGRSKPARVHVSIGNAGTLPDRVSICADPSTRRFSIRYLDDGTDVTNQVVSCWRTPRLDPGATVGITAVIRNLDAAATQSRRFAIHASSVHDPTRVDAVAVVARGR